MENYWTIDLFGDVLKISLEELKTSIRIKCDNADYPDELVDEILECISVNDENEVRIKGCGNCSEELSVEFYKILEWLHHDCNFENNVITDWEETIDEDSFVFDFGSNTYWNCDDDEEIWYEFFLVKDGYTESDRYYYDCPTNEE